MARVSHGRSLGPWPEFRTAQGAMLLVDFSLPLSFKRCIGLCPRKQSNNGSLAVDDSIWPSL